MRLAMRDRHTSGFFPLKAEISENLCQQSENLSNESLTVCIIKGLQLHTSWMRSREVSKLASALDSCNTLTEKFFQRTFVFVTEISMQSSLVWLNLHATIAFKVKLRSIRLLSESLQRELWFHNCWNFSIEFSKLLSPERHPTPFNYETFRSWNSLRQEFISLSTTDRRWKECDSTNTFLLRRNSFLEMLAMPQAVKLYQFASQGWLLQLV